MLYGLHYENSQCLTTVRQRWWRWRRWQSLCHTMVALFSIGIDHFLCVIFVRVYFVLAPRWGHACIWGESTQSFILPHLEHISLGRTFQIYFYIFYGWGFVVDNFYFHFSSFLLRLYIFFFGWKRDADSRGREMCDAYWNVCIVAYEFHSNVFFGSGHLFRPYTVAPKSHIRWKATARIKSERGTAAGVTNTVECSTHQ